MNKKALTTIFIIILTDLIGFGLVVPILPQISQQIGVSGFKLGLLVASYSFAQFFAAPFLGLLSDKYGRKPILLFSKIGTVFAYLLLAFSSNFWLFLISRLIDGFTGGNISAARAYISDVTTRENRSKGMALMGISFSLGFILGPAIGGIFFTIGGTHFLPAMIGALLSLISAIFTLFFLDEPKKHVIDKSLSDLSLKKMLKVFDSKSIQIIFLVVVINTIIFSGFQTTLSLFTGKLFNFSPANNSFLFVYMGVLGLLIQVSIMKFHFKDNLKMSIIGLGLAAIGLLMIAVSPNQIFLYLSMFVLSAGSGLCNIYLTTVLSLSHGNHSEGEVMGVFESVSSMARIIGPAIFGSLILFSPRMIFIFGALILFSTPFILSKIDLTDHKI